MSSSDDGSAAPSVLDRTNRSGKAGAVSPGIAGFQTVAGASVSDIATFLGPVRRSRYCASDWRHEPAAWRRSAGVIVTCISLSASANVAAVTSGPEPAPVPNVGGAPAVVGPDGELDGELAGAAALRHALAATSALRGALIRNWRRVFILVPRLICPPGVTFELRAIEIHVSQIARAITFGLIIEVGRRRIAALSAGGHGFGPHGLAELDDRHKAVAAGPVNLL